MILFTYGTVSIFTISSQHWLNLSPRGPPTASVTILDQIKTAHSQESALNIKYPR